MAIFYLLHNLIHGTGESSKSNGQKNCITFLFGVILYVIGWFALMSNMGQHKLFDSIQTGMIIILIADICVMGWTYRSYYGRTIINETVLNNEDNWKFDSETDKYTKKTPSEMYLEKVKTQDKVNQEIRNINATNDQTTTEPEGETIDDEGEAIEPESEALQST